VVNELFAFIFHLIDGFYKLGQQLFQAYRADELIGCLDQYGHFGNRFLVIFDIKRLRIALVIRGLADAELIIERIGREQ